MQLLMKKINLNNSQIIAPQTKLEGTLGLAPSLLDGPYSDTGLVVGQLDSRNVNMNKAHSLVLVDLTM